MFIIDEFDIIYYTIIMINKVWLYMNNRYEIAREFVEAISSDNIVQTIWFGSVARGDDTNESDIDILIIIRSDNRQVEDMIDKMVVDFILEKEEVISPHVMTEDHFNKTKDYSFLKTVMAEGMVIWISMKLMDLWILQ